MAKKTGTKKNEKYPEVKIPPFNQAPITLPGLTVLTSQRRQKIKQGEDPSTMVSEKTGNPYDYLMVLVNNQVLRFPITVPKANKSLLQAIEKKDGRGKHILLKVSGIVTPITQQYVVDDDGDEVPKTMQVDVWSEDGDVKRDLQIVNCNPNSMMSLSVAATDKAVQTLLEGGEGEGTEVPEPEEPEEEEEEEKPKTKKKPAGAKRPSRE